MTTDASNNKPITTMKTTAAQKMVIGQKAHLGSLADAWSLAP